MTAIDDCASLLAAAIDDVFATLSQLGGAFVAEWSARTADVGRYETGDLTHLQTTIFDALDTQPAFESAGYVLAEGTLADRPRHLDWWHRTPAGPYEFLLLNLDPDAPDCYDYYAMEWFMAALDGHRRFASGPLIDLPCADVYILTCSQPMVVDGRLLGIAGADVALARFESRIVPVLRKLDTTAVLVNAERRVIASNDAGYATGEKLALTPTDDPQWRVVEQVTPDLGWSLAVG